MKSYIIGSGGFAKEVYFLLSRCCPECQFEGFVDVENGEVTVGIKTFTVFNEKGFLESNVEKEQINIYLGIGDPALSAKILPKYEGFSFPNLIDPTFVGHKESILFGKGNIVTAGCVFTCNIVIGDFNIFNLNTTLGHGSTIGNINVVNPGVNISGGFEMGSHNLIGTGASILQYIKIGSNSILGVGQFLRRNWRAEGLRLECRRKLSRNCS